MNGSTQITNDETGENAGLSDVYPNFSWQNPEYMMSIENDSLTLAQITAWIIQRVHINIPSLRSFLTGFD